MVARWPEIGAGEQPDPSRCLTDRADQAERGLEIVFGIRFRPFPVQSSAPDPPEEGSIQTLEKCLELFQCLVPPKNNNNLLAQNTQCFVDKRIAKSFVMLKIP